MSRPCSRWIPAWTLLLVLALTPAAAPAAAADGLTPWDVARLRSVSSAEISPDGQHVAYVLGVPRLPFDEDNGGAWAELHVVGPDGTSRPFVTGGVNVSAVQWTPDGSAIAFLAKRDGDEQSSLYVIPVAGGEARRVLTHETGISEYSFSPDGRRVAFLSTEKAAEDLEALEKKGFDAIVFEERLQPARVWIADVDLTGGPAPATPPARRAGPRMLELEGSAKEIHWSPAGDRLLLTLAPTPLVDDEYMFRRVRVVDVASGGVVASIENPGKLGKVAWSPNGQRLAMIAGTDISDPSPGRLMVVPATGGTLTDVLPGFLGQVEDIAWRDADTLVYLASKGVETMIGRVAADGSTDDVVVPEGEAAWRSLSLADGGALALVGETAQYPAEVFRTASLGAAPARVTRHNEWLAGRELAPQEVVTYQARDGLQLEGILIRPLDERQGQRHPLILTVHGGPEAHYSNGWLTGYSLPGQVAAARGMAVFYPNYRGSTGRGVEFSKTSQGDPAGKEFDDLLDAVDHLVATGLVDGDKVGVTGGSYGGYATGWLSTRHTERFAAGVMFVGISDQVGKLGTSDIPRELYLVHARRWPWENYQLMLERSPINYVEQARTPLLILHGEEDTRVHPSQSLMLYRYLKLLDKTPVRLVLYPGEGHGNRRAAGRLDYNLRMMRWFEHYLQGPGGEPPPADLELETPPEWPGKAWPAAAAGDAGDDEADDDKTVEGGAS